MTETWGVVFCLGTFVITSTLAYRLGYTDGADDKKEESANWQDDDEENHD